MYTKVGKNPNNVPFAIQRNLCVTQSKEEARQAADNIRYTARVASSMRNKTQQLNGSILVEKPLDGELTLDDIENNALIGGPEQVAEQLIAEIEAIDPCHISLFVQFGSLPQSIVMQSMTLFGEKVLPEVIKHFGGLENIGMNIPAQIPASG